MNYQDHIKYLQSKKSLSLPFDEIKKRVFVQKTPLWDAMKVKQQDVGEKKVYLEVKEN